MQDIADLTTNVLATEPQKVEWSHRREWAGYGNGDELWGEHSDTAPEIAVEDARAAYEEAVEHYEQAWELAKCSDDPKLRFYVRVARTTANDAKRRLREVLDGDE